MRIVIYIDEQKQDCVSKLIQECIEERYVHWSLDEFMESVTNKIEAALVMFLKQNMYADGHVIAHIQWPIFEMRIALPRTKHLMRMFFVCEKNELILITWWLIKPKSYSQKKELQSIHKNYEDNIQNAHRIYQDWKWAKKYWYKDIFIHLL